MRMLILITLLCTIQAQAQELVTQGVAPNLYLTYKVVPKDNWFSVGRLFNVNAKELAKYNNVPIEKGLAIAQDIKIPLTPNNITYTSAVVTEQELTIPLYHIVGKSEGLYRVALNNGTSMQNVRDLNKLTTDALTTNTKLIVAYLKVKKGESELASNLPATQAPTPNIPIKNIPAEKPLPTVPEKELPLPAKEKMPELPAPVKEKVVVKQDPPKEKEKPQPIPSLVKLSEGESFFKTDYNKQPFQKMESTGKAATFKTMAGFTDYKYYALIDGVAAGTIIQITNTINGKVIYAKVLGEMQEVKQNHGLKIRISNATSAALDAKADVFDVAVKY